MFGCFPNLCCLERWFGMIWVGHPDWVKLCRDPNGRIKSRAKQKYEILSATKLKELLPNAIVKFAGNTSFAIIHFFFFISFTKYKPFFSTKLLSCSFSLSTSRIMVSLIFPYTADIDFVLFLTGKIPTERD